MKITYFLLVCLLQMTRKMSLKFLVMLQHFGIFSGNENICKPDNGAAQCKHLKIDLWSSLTSTLEASDEVLIMSPTTYFFIPGKYTEASGEKC